MKKEVDESLYSRQLYVLGHEAMEKMMNSSVLVVGLEGLGQEVAKNVCLAGVKSISLFDHSLVELRDLCTGFYFAEQHIGQRKDTSILNSIKELNPYVDVKVPQDIQDLTPYSVVVLCNAPYSKQIEINNLCREQKVCFIGCQEKGFFSQVFCDFLDNFMVVDTTGESSATGPINDITEEGVITVIEGERHNLEDKDIVKLVEVPHCEGTLFEVEVLTPFKFRVRKINEATTHFDFKGTFFQGGTYEQQKKPKTLNFLPLQEALKQPQILSTDGQRDILLHRCFLTLNEFFNKHSRYPRPYDEEDALLFYEMVEKDDRILKDPSAQALFKVFCKQSAGSAMPVCSVAGGFVAQEVLKACSSKFHPLTQFAYFGESVCGSVGDACVGGSVGDACHVGGDKQHAHHPMDTHPPHPPQHPHTHTQHPSDYQPVNSRYDPLIALIGKKGLEKLHHASLFLVGAGAIGCEHLKNLVMTGIAQKGTIHITDMDAIEQSNLNRQFLFKQWDVFKMKASIAAREARKLNPSFEASLIPYSLKVGPETENVFSDSFFHRLTLVANALDNMDARLYVDQRCVTNRKPLFESGTLGTKGNTQVVIPFLTESYASSRDPPEKSIPLCTLRNFPHLIEHTIEWALNEFKSQFHDKILSINEHLKEKEVTDNLSMDNENVGEDVKALADSAPCTFTECIRKAKTLFDTLFCSSIRKLIGTFPSDHVTAEGVPFWAPPKRAPVSVDFDVGDEKHLLFVYSTAMLYAQCYGCAMDGDNVGGCVGGCVGDMSSNTTIQSSNAAIQSTNAGIHPSTTVQSNSASAYESVVRLIKDVLSNTHSTPHTHTHTHPHPYFPVTFEKDDDSNHHIDFIFSCASIRADNYKIKNISRLAVKGIAGRIIPAIATTTAVVSGLSVLEMMKYILNTPSLTLFKNSFINLALPFLASSDPLPPAQERYTFNSTPLSFTLWDSFEFKDCTVGHIIAYFKEEKGVNLSMLTCNSLVVYCTFYNKSKYEENLKRMVSEIVGKKKGDGRIYAVFDVLFDGDCEVFPSVVVTMED